MLPSAESIQIILPIISVSFLVLTFRNSVYGAISYFIILNAKLGDMYPVLGAIRFELVAAVIVLASIFFTGKGLLNVTPIHNSLNKPLWILFAIGMISVPQAVDVAESWENGGYNLLKLVLFYVMLVSSINNKRDLDTFIWALLLVSAWIAYEPVVNYLNGVGTEHGYGTVAGGRFGAATGHVALANTLNQALPVAIFWALARKGKKDFLLVSGIIILLVLGIVFSRSRGGFIGLMTVSAGLVFFSTHKLRTVIVLCCLFVVLLPFAGQQYLSHMSTIKKGVSGSRSSSDRYLGLVNGISMMIKRPVLGVGIGCYARARQIYFRYYFFSHNLYGELFGELGLASVAWFYWIFMLFKRSAFLKNKLITTFSRNQPYIYILSGVQLSLVVRLMLGNFSHCAFIWFWFVMAGLVVSIDNIVIREENQALALKG